MSERVARASAWVYRGIWSPLVHIFRVPQAPPTLPVRDGEFVHSFRPAEGFLRYLKFWFWLLLWPMDIAILIAWIAIAIGVWWLGLLLLLPALFIAIVPDILVYIGIHLRYDTTWYVMTDRSIRIRRGIWVIHETTITFENVQNMKVQQGPVQRHFGIADLIIETAGAGAPAGKHGGTIGNRGVIEGVANAQELRDRILQRVRSSSSAGLGDEDETRPGLAATRPQWTAEHLAALREVRDGVRVLTGSSS